ncbi:MAG: Ger(x)C family spore germination protein [Acetanaerobacterium sp.]
MRYCVKITAIILCVMLLCGCWNRRELNTLGIVLGIGLDKGPRPGEITMTAQLENTSGSSGQGAAGGGGAPPPPYLNVTNTGTEVFSIVRDYNSEVTRKLYFPHNQILVFSEELARSGISTHLDFFLRHPECRLTVTMMVVKGTAFDALSTGPRLEVSPAMDLVNLAQSHENTSESQNVNLFDFLCARISPGIVPVLPLVTIEQGKSGPKAVVAGCAVLVDGRMVGTLSGVETRGMLWVRGEIHCGIINLEATDGTVGLEIVKAQSKITPVIRPDGTPMIKVEITETGNLGSQQGRVNQALPVTFKLLEEKQSEQIRAEALLAIALAKDLRADVFGFGQKFAQHYPKEWETMTDSWITTFETLEVEVTVKSTLIGTGKLTMPAYPVKEHVS